MKVLLGLALIVALAQAKTLSSILAKKSIEFSNEELEKDDVKDHISELQGFLGETVRELRDLVGSMTEWIDQSYTPSQIADELEKIYTDLWEPTGVKFEKLNAEMIELAFQGYITGDGDIDNCDDEKDEGEEKYWRCVGERVIMFFMELEEDAIKTVEAMVEAIDTHGECPSSEDVYNYIEDTQHLTVETLPGDNLNDYLSKGRHTVGCLAAVMGVFKHGLDNVRDRLESADEPLPPRIALTHGLVKFFVIEDRGIALFHGMFNLYNIIRIEGEQKKALMEKKHKATKKELLARIMDILSDSKRK